MPCRNRAAALDAELTRFIGRAQETSMESPFEWVGATVNDVDKITAFSLNISVISVSLVWHLEGSDCALGS